MASLPYEIQLSTTILEINSAAGSYEVPTVTKTLEIVETDDNDIIVNADSASSITVTVESVIHEIHPPGEYTEILNILGKLEAIEYRKLNGNLHQIWFDVNPPPVQVTGIWFRIDEETGDIVDVFVNSGQE